MRLESVVEVLMREVDAAAGGTPQKRSAGWRDLLADFAVGDYFAVERESRGHVYARRLPDSS